MQPFIPNQSSSIPPRGPTPQHQQQVPGGPMNNMFPQMGFINPQLPLPLPLPIPFNNNNNNGNMGGGGRPPGFINMPNFNGLQGGIFQQNMGQGTGFMGGNMIPGNGGQGLPQFGGWQNQGQNMNQFGGAMFNHAQISALNQLMGCVNQVAQGMVQQNTALLGNPQLALVQPNNVGLQQPANFGHIGQQGNFAQIGQPIPVASQQLQIPAMPFNTPLALPNQNQSPIMQGNHGKRQGSNISNGNHSRNKNFTKNPRREPPNWRSQKPDTQHMKNRGKGVESADPEKSANGTKNGKQKPLHLLYTDKEIQKWREERKKNYPTKEIVQTKLSQKQANADAADEEAKLRRQQLKEILAKQVELGFDVPEIPSHYMLDNEDNSHGKRRNRRPLNNGRRQNQNHFNKKGRFDKNNRFSSNRGTDDNDVCGEKQGETEEHFATKLKEGNKNRRKTPIKEPTLLQKLLSADMKRDKNRLLQAFRFMVMNSFFIDKTEEPLNFPTVIVEETRNGDDEELSLKEFNGGNKAHGIGDDEEPSLKEPNGINEAHGGCQEEGEITD